MADVSTYDHKEFLIIFFNHVVNFLSVGSGWLFDSVQSRSISLLPLRPTIGAASYIETPKSFHKKGFLNIQNKVDDYCFIWFILGHIYRDISTCKANMVYYYINFFNELVIAGLQFPLKFSEAPKFANLNPSISVNVLVFENNEVFPLYASKHRDRKHHVNLLMISTTKASSTTYSSGTCPLSSRAARIINIVHQCSLTACIASRRRGCLQLTYLIVPCIPNRKWSTPHPTIRRKI